MIYYILYKTTNLLNNKFYVGIHQSSSLNDTYLGSGFLITKAIKKYGRKAFTRDIICLFNSIEELRAAEEALVSEDFLSKYRELTYNLSLGGGFGSEEINGLSFKNHKHSQTAKHKISSARQGSTASPETKSKMSANNWSKRNPEAQRLHAIKAGSKLKTKTEEHKQKISEAVKRSWVGDGGFEQVVCNVCGKQGARNGMRRWHFENCGKIKKFWITDGIQNKMVFDDQEIPIGWKKGRILK